MWSFGSNKTLEEFQRHWFGLFSTISLPNLQLYKMVIHINCGFTGFFWPFDTLFWLNFVCYWIKLWIIRNFTPWLSNELKPFTPGLDFSNGTDQLLSHYCGHGLNPKFVTVWFTWAWSLKSINGQVVHPKEFTEVHVWLFNYVYRAVNSHHEYRAVHSHGDRPWLCRAQAEILDPPSLLTSPWLMAQLSRWRLLCQCYL